MKWITEGNLPSFDEPYGLDVEDSGCAVIGELRNTGNDDADSGMFVRIQSWNNEGLDYPYRADDLAANHPEIAAFAGKRVRITIEVIE